MLKALNAHLHLMLGQVIEYYWFFQLYNEEVDPYRSRYL